MKSKTKVGVIGLGYVGLPLALLISKNKFQTFGFDRDFEKIRSLFVGYGLWCDLNNLEIRHKDPVTGEAYYNEEIRESIETRRDPERKQKNIRDLLISGKTVSVLEYIIRKSSTDGPNIVFDSDFELALTEDYVPSVRRRTSRPIDFAAAFGHVELIVYLHEFGMSWTANTIKVAAINNHFDLVKFLIDQGCDVRPTILDDIFFDIEQNTHTPKPFFTSVEIVDYFKQYFDITFSETDRYLDIAMERSTADMVSYLIINGCTRLSIPKYLSELKDASCLDNYDELLKMINLCLELGFKWEDDVPRFTNTGFQKSLLGYIITKHHDRDLKEIFVLNPPLDSHCFAMAVRYSSINFVKFLVDNHCLIDGQRALCSVLMRKHKQPEMMQFMREIGIDNFTASARLWTDILGTILEEKTEKLKPIDNFLAAGFLFSPINLLTALNNCLESMNAHRRILTPESDMPLLRYYSDMRVKILNLSAKIQEMVPKGRN